jgi:uncharacterized protein
MSNTPHELAEDFPGAGEKIQALKAENAHFARLVEEYHEANRAVHRTETRLEPVEELAEVALRKTRAGLKDEISRMLAEV